MMGGGVPNQIKGWRDTSPRPFKWYLSTTNTALSCTNSSLLLVISKALSKSITACHNHHMGADDTCILYIYTQILYIGNIVMYFTIMFCFWVIYYSICHNPDSYRASLMDGYTQLLYGCLQGCLSVIKQATQLWKLYIDCRRQGAMDHVSEKKMRTYCNSAMNKILEIFAYDPSWSIMRGILIHVCWNESRVISPGYDAIPWIQYDEIHNI